MRESIQSLVHNRLHCSMNSHWDLTVLDKHDQLVLVAEVKGRLGISPEWASQFRRNIFAHGTFPDAPYFLMAFPDKFYLWTDSPRKQGVVSPDFTIDATPILRPYLEKSGLMPIDLSDQSLEVLVAAWIRSLLYKESYTSYNQPDWLVGSGLQETLLGGKLLQGTPA